MGIRKAVIVNVAIVVVGDGGVTTDSMSVLENGMGTSVYEQGHCNFGREKADVKRYPSWQIIILTFMAQWNSPFLNFLENSQTRTSRPFSGRS